MRGQTDPRTLGGLRTQAACALCFPERHSNVFTEPCPWTQHVGCPHLPALRGSGVLITMARMHECKPEPASSELSLLTTLRTLGVCYLQWQRPPLVQCPRGWLQILSDLSYLELRRIYRLKGSVPEDCSHLKHQSQVLGAPRTHTSVWRGYKVGGSCNSSFSGLIVVRSAHRTQEGSVLASTSLF